MNKIPCVMQPKELCLEPNLMNAKKKCFHLICKIREKKEHAG